MKKTFVLTMLGPDRPGIVKQLSGILTDHHASWLESRMANLAGEFAGILLASVDTDKYQSLLRDLDKLKAENLQIVVKESGAETAKNIAYLQAELEVVGTDREGIIRDITAVLSSFEINVEELSTEFSEASVVLLCCASSSLLLVVCNTVPRIISICRPCSPSSVTSSCQFASPDLMPALINLKNSSAFSFSSASLSAGLPILLWKSKLNISHPALLHICRHASLSKEKTPDDRLVNTASR